MTVSVVASFILTVLVWLWGEFSGYMQQPEVRTFMQGFFPWVLMFGLFNAALLTLSAGIRLLRRKPRDGMGAFVQFGYTFVCSLLAAFWVAYMGGDPGPPWFGVPLIAGAFLVIGALLGFWFNWLLDGRNARRDQIRKWDTDIRELGSRALGAAALLPTELDLAADTAVLAMSNAIEKVKSSGGRATLSYRNVSSPAHQELIQHCSALELVAPSSIKNSSQQLRMVFNQLLRTAMASKGIPMPDLLPRTVSDLEGSASALQDAIREHFGLR